MGETSILVERENYFKIFAMILGLIVILPFVTVYWAIKFIRE